MQTHTRYVCVFVSPWAELTDIPLYHGTVSRENIASLERAVLTALCARPERLADWPSARARLEPHVWQDPDHAAIFEAIARVEGRCLNWREYLPAQLTRMGFPDINWASFFVKEPSQKLSELIAALDRATATVE